MLHDNIKYRMVLHGILLYDVIGYSVVLYVIHDALCPFLIFLFLHDFLTLSYAILQHTIKYMLLFCIGDMMLCFMVLH